MRICKITLNNGKQILLESSSKGIANRFDNRIEIHKKLFLPKYKPLFNEIIKHEIEHSDKWWTFRDLRHDISPFKNKWMYRKFILTTPSSWIQFSPIYPSQGMWYLDITLLIFYAVIGGLFGYGAYRYFT